MEHPVSGAMSSPWLVSGAVLLATGLMGCLPPHRSWHALNAGGFGEHAQLNPDSLDFFDGKGLWLKLDTPCRWTKGHPAVVRYELQNRGPSRLMKFPRAAGFITSDEEQVRSIDSVVSGEPCGRGAHYVHEGARLEGEIVLVRALSEDVVGNAVVTVDLVGVGYYEDCLGRGTFEISIRVPHDPKVPVCKLNSSEPIATSPSRRLVGSRPVGRAGLDAQSRP